MADDVLVEVTYEETWSRTGTVKISEGEFEQWAGHSVFSASESKIREFLDSTRTDYEDQAWFQKQPPGSQDADEYLGSDLMTAKVRR